MARLRLTVGKITVATEKETGKFVVPVSLLNMSIYEMSLVNFSFKKKMYQPTEVLADLSICKSDKSNSIWKPLQRNQIEALFKHQQVKLEVVRNDGDENDGELIDIVGDDYYVQEARPCYYPDSMVVKLKIYSMDKLLTLTRQCKSWTAKKLSDHILKKELPNYPVPYNKDESEMCVKCDTSHMKHLVKNGQEHIFPYLVQYNESFYDMLIRTCNRWGEFVYWEDGKLNIGCNTDDAKEISGYHSITFQDYTTEQTKGSTYASEAPYDNNVLKSVVKKDGAAKIFATMMNAVSTEDGADFYWLRKVGQLLTNSKSITNFVFDTAVNDLIAYLQAESLFAQRNDKHNKNYFKKEKKYISTLDEQYSDGKYNQFSESKPIVDAEKYAQILVGEMMAEQNIVEIDYDTTWPGLKLGDVIKVNDELCIVVEIGTKEGEPDKFQVKAIAKVNNDFYPTIIPSGHIRTSGPQVAVVVDVDDPQKKNRVRLEYPWQLSSLKKGYEEIVAGDLKSFDISDATPWLLFAASSGPIQGGVHGRHYLAEKVIVNYANNNVERPFVVGSVTTEIPKALKTSAAVMVAPNGEYIKVHEGLGTGATAFISNFTPGASLISGFFDFPDVFNLIAKDGQDDKSSAFEGGVEMGDKYGIWNISCSTDKRSIKINSPWGNVAVNAFTGITISAPNGDIRIKGKNVSIEAGNNLSLVSGTNIKNKFASTYGDGAGYNMVSFAYDVQTMASKKLGELAESVIDVSLLRSLVETFWRPQEGALSLQSNRYLKLGAGGAKPGYPYDAYKNPQKRLQKDIDESGMLKMGPVMTDLLGKLPPIVYKMEYNYKEQYKACVRSRLEFEQKIRFLMSVANGKDLKPTDICKSYDDLKAKLWDPKTKEITLADLDFKDCCKSEDTKDVEMAVLLRTIPSINIASAAVIERAKRACLNERKRWKSEVVGKANELLRNIAKLRTEPQKYGDLKTFGLARRHRSWPANYYETIEKAFSQKNCKDTFFFKYAYDQDNVVTDERANLTLETLEGLNLHNVALFRRAALTIVESWGMDSQPIAKKLNEQGAIVDANIAKKPDKPVTDADFENNNKWNLYVSSLEFGKTVGKQGGSWKDAMAEPFNSKTLKIGTPFTEYGAWANAKTGQILFGTGATYSMKNDGTISLLDTRYNQGKLSKALKNDADNAAYDNLNLQVQDKLKTLDARGYKFNNDASGFVVVERDENNADDNNQEQPNVEIENNGAQ